MNPEPTAETAYEQLLGLLREFDLAWVAEEVEGAVQIGKTILPAYVGTKPDAWLVSYATDPDLLEKNDISGEPYSAAETLAIAIEAVRQALVVPSDVRSELPQLFDVQLTGFRFVSEDGEAELSLSVGEQESQAVASLRHSLAEGSGG